MNQRELNRAIARVTGETVHEIASRGFVPLTSVPIESEDKYIDWDDFDINRNVSVYSQGDAFRPVEACV